MDLFNFGLPAQIGKKSAKIMENSDQKFAKIMENSQKNNQNIDIFSILGQIRIRIRNSQNGSADPDPYQYQHDNTVINNF